MKNLRPWHIMVAVLALSIFLIGLSYFTNERAKDILLGIGVNLLSSIVFFILLELYWEKIKQVNGKEVNGFDYQKFAHNIRVSNRVRIMGTFIYPFTDHPKFQNDRMRICTALRELVSKRTFAGVEILFLHPESASARMRAQERSDDDVILRMQQGLRTLAQLREEILQQHAGLFFEVRLLMRAPAFALFQTDNFASISFYYRDRAISEVTRYEFFSDTPLGIFVERTFEDLWRDSRTVPLSEYLEKSTT